MMGQVPSDELVRTVKQSLVETASLFEPNLAAALSENFTDAHTKARDLAPPIASLLAPLAWSLFFARQNRLQRHQGPRALGLAAADPSPRLAPRPSRPAGVFARLTPSRLPPYPSSSPTLLARPSACPDQPRCFSRPTGVGQRAGGIQGAGKGGGHAEEGLDAVLHHGARRAHRRRSHCDCGPHTAQLTGGAAAAGDLAASQVTDERRGSRAAGDRRRRHSAQPDERRGRRTRTSSPPPRRPDHRAHSAQLMSGGGAGDRLGRPASAIPPALPAWGGRAVSAPAPPDCWRSGAICNCMRCLLSMRCPRHRGLETITDFATNGYAVELRTAHKMRPARASLPAPASPRRRFQVAKAVARRAWARMPPPWRP